MIRALRKIASVLRKARIRLISRGRVSFGDKVLVDAGVVFRVSGDAEVNIGENAFVGRHSLIVAKGSRIAIGANTHLSHGLTLVATQSIAIGSDCLIGEYVTIRDQDHGIESGALFRLQECVAAPIQIGSNVWIGAHCTVLKSSKIGPNAVIGANSLVNGDLSGNAIHAGTPARTLRDLEVNGQ